MNITQEQFKQLENGEIDIYELLDYPKYEENYSLSYEKIEGTENTYSILVNGANFDGDTEKEIKWMETHKIPTSFFVY